MSDMIKICLFAGTTEGRKLTEWLAERSVLTDVFVATEYGKEELTETKCVSVHAGRLDADQIYEKLSDGNYRLVLDATHPYAREVSQNIRVAAEHAGVPVWRVLRDGPDGTNSTDAGIGTELIHVADLKQAIEFLKTTTGNIFVSTGSKELSAFCVLPDWQERVYARVLSLPEVVAECASLGFQGKHLIAMQGPFTRELNAAFFRSVDAKWLVTKESGKAGGFEEKILAAKETGVRVVVIGRPEEEGLSLEETFARLERELTGQSERSLTISLIGAGPGNPELLTGEARKAIEDCDLLVGAKRVVEQLACFGKPTVKEYRAEAILSYLHEHPEYKKVAVAFSGDTGFYSGAKQFVNALSGKLRIIPGISSVNYFFARIGKTWDHSKLLSMHGRDADIVTEVQKNRSVFLLAGDKNALSTVCERLCAAGLAHAAVTVGENLSLENEKIYTGTAEVFAGKKTGSLTVILVECNTDENEAVQPVVKKSQIDRAVQPVLTHGLADEQFIRGDVPMTKMEVRAVSLSKLGLAENTVVYDIGAGTGSIAIECARLSSTIRVYAIERKPEAVELLRQNRAKFGLPNLEIVEGIAPEALEGLPVPTHVFIGGTGGKMKEIVTSVLAKNPGVRVVMNLIMPESVAAASEILNLPDVTGGELVQITVARSKETKAGHLMIGQNPVWIVSFTGKR